MLNLFFYIALKKGKSYTNLKSYTNVNPYTNLNSYTNVIPYSNANEYTNMNSYTKSCNIWFKMYNIIHMYSLKIMGYD